MVRLEAQIRHQAAEGGLVRWGDRRWAAAPSACGRIHAGGANRSHEHQAEQTFVGVHRTCTDGTVRPSASLCIDPHPLPTHTAPCAAATVAVRLANIHPSPTRLDPRTALAVPHAPASMRRSLSCRSTSPNSCGSRSSHTRPQASRARAAKAGESAANHDARRLPGTCVSVPLLGWRPGVSGQGISEGYR